MSWPSLDSDYMAPIRIGFIGLSTTGWAASALFPSLIVPSVRSNFTITALCTTSPSSASTASTHYAQQTGTPIRPYHGDSGLSQIVNDPQVDFVVVSVKAPSHKDAVLRAIEAGKDVFVEWPVGASLDETKEIEECARRKGVTVVVGLQGRHSAAIRKIKEVIDSGKIGKVLSSTFIGLVPRELAYWGPNTTERSVYAHKPGSGATMLEIIAGHQLDSFTYLLGDFTSVSATSTIIYPTATIIDAPTPKTITITTPDHISFSGILSSGALASFTYRGGYANTPGRRQLVWEIDGEDGSIRVEEGDDLGGGGALLNIRDPDVYVCGEKVDISPGGLVGNLAAGWVEYVKEKKGEGKGRYATIGEAVKNRRLVKAIEDSAREGRRVEL